MFEIIRYSADRADEWNRFVAESKNGTFLFDRNYMDYHADRFSDASLMCYLGGRLYAVLPANISDGTFFSHQGLSYGGLIMTERATTADVCCLFREINEVLRRLNVCKVCYKPVPWIYHRLPAEEDLYALFITCKAYLSARNVASVISPARPVKWRYSRRYDAKRALANGVVVECSDDFCGFWEILADNLMQKFGTLPVHTLEEILLLKSRFPDLIQLWVARDAEGTLLAGTVMYVCGGVVRSQYISASPEGKRLHAVDAIYDHLVHVAYANAAFIDMGTSNMPHSSELHDSLIFQKEGFGGRAVCYDTYEWTL